MRISHRTTMAAAAYLVCLSVPALAGAAVESSGVTSSPAPAALPADAFSPSFLGMYRKVMRIESDITTYAKKYDVDPTLARAVCMYESGGDGNLTSGAGARGYFQVMPATFRLLHVATNIEAGIKYLSQLVDRFGREDYALAAYNAGPKRVVRGRGLPLESLQYVLGVGYYRSVLKMYEPSVRTHAATLELATSHAGDDWTTLAGRLKIPAVQLRLYNPFLSDLRLRHAEHLIAYPPQPTRDLVETSASGLRQYRARIGDNYISLAMAFGVDVDALRSANDLWRLQVLPTGMVLTIPAVPARPAAASQTRPATAVRHVVKRGDTLGELARRYRTTVRALQRVNGLGGRTRIRVGQRLRIPAR